MASGVRFRSAFAICDDSLDVNKGDSSVSLVVVRMSSLRVEAADIMRLLFEEAVPL